MKGGGGAHPRGIEGTAMGAEPLVEVWRGEVLESVHAGHAVVCDPGGAVREAWGEPGVTILPRSSCKMIQALPLAEAGEADPRRLALACASHEGAAIHVRPVEAWLAELGLSDGDLRCGVQPPRDAAERDALIRAGAVPRQVHNNCSGKHAGFLQVARALGGGSEYADADHPVQRAVRAAFEEATGAPSPTWAVDGCSVPNFACTLRGLATAMARFAAGEVAAMTRLREAMTAHPELVAGEGRACTALMRAMDGVAVKVGAEGVYVAILPGPGLGVALKVLDGAGRAAECAAAAILARLGALDAKHPLVAPTIRNWRGIATGRVTPAAALRPWPAPGRAARQP